jgi:hypothetical protein
MPEKKHVRGVGEKEQRRYEHIKEEAEKGRYPGREKEVARPDGPEGAQGKGAQERRIAWPAGPDGHDRRRRRWLSGQRRCPARALDEAGLRGSSLRVVHVYQPPRMPPTEAGVGAAGGMGVPVFAENDDELGRAAKAEAMNVIEEALRRTGGDSRHELEIERAAVADGIVA